MNIIDFVKINGNKTFDDKEFNEVDGIILAQLSYLNYKEMCTSFNDIIDSANLNSYETSILLSTRNSGLRKDDQRLILEVLSSSRYKSIKFAHYINLHDAKTEKQFVAITFIFDKFICVSFMGTDDTILGWKEDFSMSYLKSVPSQLEGIKYLDKIASMYNLPLIIVGHSKGGNIAIYASSNSKKEIKEKIKTIYAYDSPGFNKEFISSDNFLAIQNKINVYLPESSFIGLIMYNSNYKIVASNKLFVFQHNVYNWLVNENTFVYKDKLTKKSLAFAESNRQWIENFNDEERKIFFDTIFNLLEVSETRSFLELKNNWKNEATRIIKNSKEISEEHKQLMIEITKNMFMEYLKLLFNKKN